MRINCSRFFSPDTNSKIKQLIKSGEISLNDIKIIVKSEVVDIYNNILHGLVNRGTINPAYLFDTVVPESAVIDVMSCYNISFEKFHILCNADLCEKCGDGYIFNRSEMYLNESENNRLLDLIYDFGIIVDNF